MIVDIEKYALNRPFIRTWIEQNRNIDLKKAIGILASSIGVPCIVVAYYLGEVSGWPLEIEESIQTYMKFYRYDEVLNIPKDCPYR